MVKANKKKVDSMERVLEQNSLERKGARNEEVRSLNWEETIVITGRDFHDDWSRILNFVKKQTECSFIINPFSGG